MSSSSSPCAACKLLRRKCTQGCVFAPYFPPDNPAKFANVHRVFGASNVSKLLNELPQAQREDAVNSLAYEAEARLRDPVYGCVSYISVLQLRIKQTRDELAAARKELAGYIGPAAFASFVAPPSRPSSRRRRRSTTSTPACRSPQPPGPWGSASASASRRSTATTTRTSRSCSSTTSTSTTTSRWRRRSSWPRPSRSRGSRTS